MHNLKVWQPPTHVCGNAIHSITNMSFNLEERSYNLLTSEATGVSEVRKELRSELQGTPAFER